MFRRLMRDVGDGGGSSDSGAGPSGGVSSPGGVAPGSSSAAPNGGAGAGGGSKPSDKAPGGGAGDKSVDVQAVIAERDTLKTEHEKMKTEFEKLKVTVGKQGNELGAFNALKERIKSDPRGIASEILKTAGVEAHPMNFDSASLFDEQGNVKLTKDTFPAFMSQLKEAVTAEARMGVAPEINRIFEDNLRRNYPDFDELADTRSLLSAGVLGKKLTYLELTHLAARGYHVAEALEAAKQAGKAERDKELADKANGVLSPPGGGGNQGGGKHDPNNPEYFSKVVKGMRKNRR